MLSKAFNRALTALAWGIGIVLFLWLLWFVGMVLECEYPYIFTLYRVRHGLSVEGTPAASIVTADGADWGWHTCSYCADYCGPAKNLVSVSFQAPGHKTVYYFAYCYDDHTIVPMTDETAAHFPSLMPKGDFLEGVNQLNGKAGTLSVGAGDLKLPASWFKKVTGVRRSPSTNQPKESPQ